ncbi:MAG: DNA polymerase III subunit beta [Gemmataceae bacterium]|nr:DNA polymerase III subunit beta [Gemmataceae bacterium]MDW8264807.1 DNA polymerase III subunit beta [Gemmataceae bacterium]
MKAVCHREALLSAGQLASVAVSSRDVKPILRNLKLSVQPDRCIVMATDLELGIRMEVRSIQVEEPGDAIFPATTLISILRESTDEQLRLEADSTVASVRGESNEYEIPSEEPDAFPDLPSFDDKVHHEVLAEPLRQMIRRTLFATAKENARYAMTGVLWELEEGKVRLVATDGRRLAVCEGEATGPKEHVTKGLTHVVPTKAMSLLERVVQSTQEPVRVCLKANEAMFQTDRATIYSRLVEGRFPDYRSVLPKRSTAKVSLSVGPFHTAIRQAAVVVDEETRRLRLNFGQNRLTLQAQGTTSGRCKVEMPIDLQGKELSIAFEPSFLTDMLRVLDPSATLTLEMTDGESPAVFRCGPEYCYIVMPLV